MSDSGESDVERKILDHLKRNGQSKALTISKALKIAKKTANKHLYDLEKSKRVKRSVDEPPVWDIMERREEATSQKPPDTLSEKKLSEILRSKGRTGLKAHQIAGEMNETRQSVNKLLYKLQDKGEVQKSENNMWRSHGDGLQAIEDVMVSGSGLSPVMELIEELGEGGFGCVYKVKHKYDDKVYAVKKVDWTEGADTEVKALAKLEHPNIVRYITCWTSSQDWKSCQGTSGQSDSSGDISNRSGNQSDDDTLSGMESLSISDSRGYLFIQMEFCEGGTLTSWLHQRNFNKIERNIIEIHKIFHEIVCGVEYIHSKGLIHRDLKPDNILFGADGKVKIGDFGLVATMTNPDGAAIYRTRGRGTQTYMSPEQGLQSDYDAKTDIFPLGLIWFEMLWKLTTGMERTELWSDLRSQKFPEEFCDHHRTEHKFIKMMLSQKPEERPHVTEIKEKLDTFFSMNNNLCQKTI